MKSLIRRSASVTAAALIAAGGLAGPAWAQETTNQVSGRAEGPGVTAETVLGEQVREAATESAGASASAGPVEVEVVSEVVLGEQARANPIVLPRTGGVGEAAVLLGMASGAAFTLAGLRLRAGRRTRRD